MKNISRVVGSIIIISGIAGCGMLRINKKGTGDEENKGTGDEENKRNSESALGNEVVKVIKLFYAQNEIFELKLVEGKSSKGVVLSRDTYEYSDKRETKSMRENFNSDGTRRSMSSSSYTTGPCYEWNYLSEYFGKYPSRSQTRTTRVCSAEGDVASETTFSIDPSVSDRVRQI